jgi:hypothetical protein
MDQLPADFAETLARVLEPGHEKRIAQIIEAATRLDDEGLRLFLERFAARVRTSSATVKPEELAQFLLESNAGGPSSAT